MEHIVRQLQLPILSKPQRNMLLFDVFSNKIANFTFYFWYDTKDVSYQNEFYEQYIIALFQTEFLWVKNVRLNIIDRYFFLNFNKMKMECDRHQRYQRDIPATRGVLRLAGF